MLWWQVYAKPEPYAEAEPDALAEAKANVLSEFDFVEPLGNHHASAFIR